MSALAKQAKWLLAELLEVLTRSAEAAVGGLTVDARDQQYAWRVVGIPKRGSEDGRPIAVGSVVVPAWHRVLIRQMPELPEGQWCGRRGVSVVQAKADWLAAKERRRPLTPLCLKPLRKPYGTEARQKRWWPHLRQAGELRGIVT